MESPGYAHRVSPLTIRRWSRRLRRRRIALVAVIALTAAIAAHHSAAAIGDMHHDPGMGAAMELCLGVFAAVGAAVAAVALGFVVLGRWRPAAELLAVGLAPVGFLSLPRVRAGPALLSLISVRRR